MGQTSTRSVESTLPLALRLRQLPPLADVGVSGVRAAAGLALRAYLRTYHRLEIVGREHLPRAGSFVMVANHASHLDALCLLAALPLARLSQAFPAAAQEVFFRSARQSALTSLFINAVPVPRQAHARRSLALCRRLLASHGNILILFPEGTRTATGEMGRFRPGIGALLAGSSVPVVPCAVQGSFAAWPKGRRWPRPGALRVAIGPARRYGDLRTCRASMDQIAGELHDIVEGLL